MSEALITKDQLAEAAKSLTSKEAHALKYFHDNKQIQISVDKSAELYGLFKNNIDTDEIRKLNPGFSLGQIVHARVRDKWDEQLAEQNQRLIESVGPRVAQAQAEAAQFLSDMLSAAMKLHHTKIKKYLQDGDAAHLKGTPLEDSVGFRKMAEIIQTLQQVTGQDKKKVVEHRGGVTVNHTAKKVDQDEAANILDALVVGEE